MIVFMRWVTIIICCAAIAFGVTSLLSGCATVTKSVTGPHGYTYTEKIMAIGGGSIEEATQSFGGTLEVWDEDNQQLIKVVLDSDASSTNTSSSADVLLAIIGKIPVATP